MGAEVATGREGRTDSVGFGWLQGYIGNVQIVYMDGRVTDASFEAYVEALCHGIDSRTPADPPVAVVYHVPQPSALSSTRRRRLGEALKAREAVLERTTLAYAMATPSFAVRAGLRMLFWLAPPRYPNAVVATPREGFAFVARYLPGLDADELAAEFERRVAAAAERMATR